MEKKLSLLLIALSLMLCCSAATTDSVAVVFKERGIADMRSQLYSEAIENFVLGVERAEKAGDSVTYNICLANIAAIYGYTGNFDRSLYYLKRTYDWATNSGDSTLRAQIIINLVGTYCQKGDLENAERYFIESNRIPLPDVRERRYYFLYNQALIANLRKDPKMAVYYHRQAADYMLENGRPDRAITQYVGIARISLSEKKSDESLHFLDMADALASKSKNRIKLIDIWKLKSKVYLTKGDSANYQLYKSQYLSLSDSVFCDSQINRATNHLFDYENKLTVQNIGRLNESLRTHRLTIVFFAIITLIMAISITIITVNLKRLRKARIHLIERNEELMKESAANNAVPVAAAVAEPTQLLMTSEQIEALKRRILGIMNSIEVISRSDFSLVMLAEMVDSNTRYVSKVINMSFGKNFRAFLNEYRIREACVRLADTEHYGKLTIQTIYKDLGYSSAGGFIDAFKKINGMSPSVYQKLAKSRAAEKE